MEQIMIIVDSWAEMIAKPQNWFVVSAIHLVSISFRNPETDHWKPLRMENYLGGVGDKIAPLFLLDAVAIGTSSRMKSSRIHSLGIRIPLSWMVEAHILHVFLCSNLLVERSFLFTLTREIPLVRNCKCRPKEDLGTQVVISISVESGWTTPDGP